MENLAELDLIMTMAEEADAPTEQAEEFRIADDGAAGWALRKIRRAREDHAAYAVQCNARIAQLQAAIDRIIARLNVNANEAARTEEFFRSKLAAYFDCLPEAAIRTAKTQRKYVLPEGELIVKSPSPQKSCADEEKLLFWLRENQMYDKIKVTEKPKWAEIKAELAVTSAGAVHPATGEIVPGVTVIIPSPTFEIKI